ncbi:natural cytotoxicity triggering receptor 3-like [Stegostoma tigrinum]|uniref:natural cytotoxicity triggering receptor 3-like n=1 Tax=Stegostoma tigrinum TaxID=3053191 RepID=UPI00287032A0|nr:natural cytotoxicity triggering receptor 3-like [Stegostoma tigrinum]
MNPSPILWILAVFLVSGIGAKKFQVVQKLPRILADEGQSVLIPCEWTGNVSLTIGSFKWLKDGAEVSNQTAKYTGRVHRPQQDFIHSRNASLLLKGLKVTDSGMYRCSVKFMQLGEEYGNGTQLTVRVSGIGAKKFQVVQKLPRILADEGQSVLIPCEWTGAESY